MLITAGLFAVIVGLMFFMEGLGIGVRFAEPVIGALQAAGANISVENAPYLKEKNASAQ